jgi:phospholipid/cholesterol/gamma-HCH transport system permease protein
MTLVRELGPVLTAIIGGPQFAGWQAGGVDEGRRADRRDARWVPTDQKLVTPRVIATCVMLPLLTIIADFIEW